MTSDYFYRSLDDGRTWQGNAANDYYYRLDVDESNRVYILGINYGIKVSADNGMTWTPCTITDDDLISMHFFGKGTTDSFQR